MRDKTGLLHGRGTAQTRTALRVAGVSAPVPLGRMAARAALSLGLAAAFLWLLADRWAGIDRAALASAVAQIQPQQWAVALLATAASFWAVGRYDVVLHRHLATDTPERIARNAGICAIAVSQTLGLGLISGAILRWRMLPGFSLWQATRLTAAVALSFLAGWAVVTSATLLALPMAPWRGGAAAVLGLALLLAGLSLAAPRLSLRNWRWPNGFTLTRLLGLCATDTFAAALAFHALLPETSALEFTTLLPAFLLALGAGLVLGTPGGVGPFEVTLLTLLPQTSEAELLAVIVAWRLVYHALPAVLGAALALRGPKGSCRTPAPTWRAVSAKRAESARAESARAELGLRHQGRLAVIQVTGGQWLAGRTGHALIALLDPSGPRSRAALDAALQDMAQSARREGRIPVLYKASARLAARARGCGQALRRIGWEAWLVPRDYQLSDPRRSGLRRKLRRAASAGVTVCACSAHDAPWDRLDGIAAKWAATHGAERGFSMGRHDRAYLARQRLYIAWAGNRPIAYASFHSLASEWALDLMRHEDALPDGTMHSLVQAAIDDAARAKVPRLSLAAVPDGAMSPQDLAGRLIAALAPQTAATGLFRFKSSFAPRWSPLYLAAPNPPGLMLAGLSLWRAIARPGPLMPEIERNHAEYGFASGPDPWHIEEDSR